MTFLGYLTYLYNLNFSMNNIEVVDIKNMPSEYFTTGLTSKNQTLDDASAVPANFVEIEVISPIARGDGLKRYTYYEVMLNTNFPIFCVEVSSVRRRYGDFKWLRSELERHSKINLPSLPSKAITRQLPFRSDDGTFEEGFIEDRQSRL